MTLPIFLSSQTFLPSTAPLAGREELSRILLSVGLAGKLIARELQQAGKNQLLGSTGMTNIQGEEVQKLDDRANRIFVEVFEQQHHVSTVVSEEMEHPYLIKAAEIEGRYALFIDPLDGSANSDVNAPLGSIFSIHQLSHTGIPVTQEDLQKMGSEQVAAGYLLYGSSVLMVFTFGQGVHQFYLDPEIGEFYRWGNSFSLPKSGRTYSVNEGNQGGWSSSILKLLAYFQESDPLSKRPYSARYTGCLVADVHRILCKGGIYMYPKDKKNPEGKLRLMYEAAPLSFIMEQAGGSGSTGSERISRIQPRALHQRVPLFIGSPDDVAKAEEYLQTEPQT